MWPCLLKINEKPIEKTKSEMYKVVRHTLDLKNSSLVPKRMNCVVDLSFKSQANIIFLQSCSINFSIVLHQYFASNVYKKLLVLVLFSLIWPRCQRAIKNWANFFFSNNLS